MMLESQLNQFQSFRRGVGQLLSTSEQSAQQLQARCDTIQADAQRLRDQVVCNGNTANDNIDNAQGALEVVRGEIQSKCDELVQRIGTAPPMVSDAEDAKHAVWLSRLAAIEHRAVQLGTAVSSCIAT